MSEMSCPKLIINLEKEISTTKVITHSV